MKKQIDQVREFRQRFNLPMDGCKTMQDCLLHERLIQEELDEMKNADDLIELSDAIIDQIYLLFGYAIHLGIDDKLESMFDEVHASNMSKLDRFNKPIYREDGKVLKGENYFAPNIKKIIEK